MKILILGAKGMLGAELSSVFRDLDPILWDLDDLDITQVENVKSKIAVLKPEIIINAAAYTDVDGAEKNQDIANKVNGKAIESLAEIANKIGSILVNYSTDYVFDGKKKEGYQEDDPINPINAYGKSKLLGEKAIKNCEKYYLIRSSWLFGKHGKNFVETIIKLGNSEKEVKVVNDQFGKPTYALDLAKRTRELIASKKEYGIYHIVNEDETSWYNFAGAIFQQAKISTKLIPVPSAQFPQIAERPAHSVLINTKLSPLRSWKEALKDYLNNR